MIQALVGEIIAQNTLSEEESYALRWTIRGTQRANTPKNCDFCNKPEFHSNRVFKDKRDRRKFINATKKKFGCMKKKAEVPFRFNDGYQLWKCPVKIGQESSLSEYLRFYAWLDHQGILPYGDLSQLSEKFVVAMEVIRTEYRIMDKEHSEEQKKKR